MPSLYQLTNDVMMLQDLLEEGVIDESTYADTVESLGVADKVESICMVMKNLEHKAAAYKAEIDRMTQRKKTLENGVERLKQSLVEYMSVAEVKKVEAGLFTVSLGKSKSVNIVDEAAIPCAFLVEQPPKIDKTAIGKALKAGEAVQGAELVEKPFTTIR